MKTADSFYSKYEFPLRRDRSSGVYTKDDLLEFAEAFATERDQEIIKMIDEMIKTEEKARDEFDEEESSWAFIEGRIFILKELRSKL